MFSLTLALTVSAQSVQPVYQKPDRTILPSVTITNAATTNVTFSSIGSKVKSFQTPVTKTSGTVAGKVYLQGTVDGVGWITIDSLVLSDQAINSKSFAVTSTSFNSYRAQCVSTGTLVVALTFSYMRRPDE